MLNLFQAVLVGAVPALFSSELWHIFTTLPPGQNRKRALAVLMMVGIILIAAIGMAFQPGVTGYAAAPAAIGLLALSFLRVWDKTRAKPILILLLGTAAVVIAYFYTQPAASSLFILLGAALVLTLSWKFAQRDWGRITVLVISVFGLIILGNDYLLSTRLPQLPRNLGMAVGALLYFLPGLVTSLAAVLLVQSIENFTRSKHPLHKRSALIQLFLSISIVGWLASTIYWSSAWDQTNDGLSGVALLLPAGLTAVASSMFIVTFTTPKLNFWRWLLGLVFALMLPLAFFQASQMGWDFDYHTVTASRAARIAAALDQYNLRQDRYPTELTSLFPRELLYLPQPFQIRGETWCYQAWNDPAARGYRLGALFRDNFSLPVEVKIYASRGVPPSTEWDCSTRLEKFQTRLNLVP